MVHSRAAPPMLKRRMLRVSLLGLLLGIFFMLGATLTAIVAARVFLPVAAAGLATGLIGLSSASASAAIDALHTGDSETRKTVLIGLKESFSGQPGIDAGFATWILPAIDHCKTDQDPEVIALAEEVTALVQSNRANQPK